MPFDGVDPGRRRGQPPIRRGPDILVTTSLVFILFGFLVLGFIVAVLR